MGGRFGIWWRITMHQTGRSQKRTNKWFAGMPRKISQGNSNGFFGKEMQENFANGFFGNLKRFFSGRSKRFFGARNTRKNFRTAHKNFPKFASKFGNKLVTKRVAKDIDPTRVKRIKPTNKDKIRLRLEKNNYFHRKVIRVSSASSKRLS